MSLESTIKRFKELGVQSLEITYAVLDGGIPGGPLDDIELVRRGLEWVRETLSHHLRDGELGPGDYDYLVSATYVVEVPVVVAGAVGWLAAARDFHEREQLWHQVEQKELRSVERLIANGRRHLFESRVEAGTLRWSLRLMKIAWAGYPGGETAVPGDPAGGGASDPSAFQAGPATARRRIPLGFGDFSFKLYAAGAAIRHLSYLSKASVILLQPSDADLVDDDVGAIRRLEAFLMQLVTRGAARPETPNTLLLSAGIGLVKAEASVARFRLSRRAMLIRAKVYLLRAAAYLSHCWSAERAQIATGEDTRAEQKWALWMARRCLNKGAEHVRQSRSLWAHDLLWRTLRADLSVDLRSYTVLQQYNASDVEFLMAALEEKVELAEAERSPDKILGDDDAEFQAL